MTRNEAQTRFELIDTALFARGWQREDIRIEETLPPVDIIHHKAHRRAKGRTDYVLRRPLSPGTEPIPLAIIEAKREDLPPEHGLQQAKGYRYAHLNNVPFVFSSNGNLFVTYDADTATTSEPQPMSEFPKPEDLLKRYLNQLTPNPQSPDLQLLKTGYKQGRSHLRYYQDAAVRAALEKIIRQRQQKEPPRVLLSLATGAGKTRLAAALLRRIFDANFMGKALFVCDRTELRDHGLADFQAAFGTDAAEVNTRKPQKNARVLIATYQTLDKSADGETVNFFLKNYPPGYFDVIVIDECHRSAWGDWFVVLQQNKQAIQIGLTATPREIKMPDVEDQATRQEIEEDRRFLAHNLRYFGPAAYEYPYLQGVADGFLAPVELETFDIFHDRQKQPERVRGVYRKDLKGKKLTNVLTGQVVPDSNVAERTEGAGIEAKLVLPERVAAMCAHFFDRLLKTGDGDPLQKTIIFCAGDHHADLVTNELNRLYAEWCKAHSLRRIPTYAFKCMSSTSGQSLIPDFRSRQRSHIIATTKDLLTTGVDVPCVRNIVFFRYVQSPILFHQMIGRGTRIHEETSKIMFRVFDYTGATTLFGADFVTPPPPPPSPPTPPTPPGPPPVKAKGFQITITDTGKFNVMQKDGRATRVTPQEYRQRLVEELTATVPTLAEFRAKWIDPTKRRELLELFAGQGLLPAAVRDAAQMEEYDEFDVLAALAYGIQPLTRTQRAAQFDGEHPAWLVQLPPPTAKVIRAIVRQFERAGTDGLDSNQLWQTPELRPLKPVAVLKQAGNPAELLRKTKETLFAA